MADENYPIGLKISIDPQLDQKIKKIEETVAAVGNGVKSEMEKMSEHFLLPINNIDQLIQRINGIKTAIDGVGGAENLTKTLSSLSTAAAQSGGGGGLADLTQKIEELKNAFATGGENPALVQAVRSITDASVNTAANISRLSEQMAGLNTFGLTESLQKVATLSEQFDKLTTAITNWKTSVQEAGAASKSSFVNLDNLNKILDSQVGKESTLTIKELTKQINNIGEALRRIGSDDSLKMDNALQQKFVDIRYAYEQLRKTLETPTDVAQTKQLKEWQDEYDKLQQKLEETNKQKSLIVARGGTPTDETEKYIATLTERLEELKKKIEEVKKEDAGDILKSFDAQRMLQAAQAASQLAEALEKIRIQKEKASQTAEQREYDKDLSTYKSLTNQLVQAQAAKDKFDTAMKNHPDNNDVMTAASKGAKDAQQEIDELKKKIDELKDKYKKRGNDSFGASTDLSSERKANVNRVNEFIKAEKEKTAIEQQEAKNRRDDEIAKAKVATETAKQERLKAQAEATTQRSANDTQRTSIATDKEEREKQLQVEREKAISAVRAQIDALDKTDVNYAQNLAMLNQVLTNLINQKSGLASVTREVTEEDARNSKTVADNTGKLSDYEKALQKVRAAIANVDRNSDAYTRLNAMQVELTQTVQKLRVEEAKKAVDYANSTRTLSAYEAAVQKLTIALKDTPRDSATFKELNKYLQQMGVNAEQIRQKMQAFKKEMDGAKNSAGDLQRMLAQAFSIAAITGYIKKVVEVRAQFELQRIALGAILQDIDKANAVFKQVQNMALESPFSIMQLEKATKQMAAFGVEADKLQPTVKTLADISAGLGVDIDRLILVYGHIKANNALQQLHVRQFTNAGFNIAGELAKYYSEMEDKMVSVAEVTQRIHKKMVSFADVEEVLKRATSAGGMFYDMQAKQADSLAGKMQRIQDQMDLMLNEIGQSNQGIISWVLDTIRELMKSWRSVSEYIKSAAVAMSVFLVTNKLLPALVGTVTKLGWAIKQMGIALGICATNAERMTLATKATWWGVLLTIITAIGVAIYEAVTATSKLQDELARINQEGAEKMVQLETEFKKLADTIRDSSKSYDEQQEAIKELNRVYGEILPKEMREVEYIKSMADGYKEATDAIEAYQAAKSKRLAEDSYITTAQELKTGFANDSIKNTYNYVFKDIVQSVYGEKYTEKVINTKVKQIWGKIAEEIEQGKTLPRDYKKRFNELFSDIFNIDLKTVSEENAKTLKLVMNYMAVEVSDYVKDINEAGNQLHNATADFSSLTSVMSDEMRESAEPAIKTYNELISTVDKLNQKEQALNKIVREGDAKTESGDYTEDYKKLKKEIQDLVTSLNRQLQSIGADQIEVNIDVDATNAYNTLSRFRTETAYVLDAINKDAKKKGNQYLTSVVQTLTRNVSGNNLAEQQGSLMKIVSDATRELGYDISLLDKMLPDAADNVTTYAQKLKGNADNLKASLDLYDQAAKSQYKFEQEGRFAISGFDDEESYEKAKSQYDLLILLIKALMVEKNANSQLHKQSTERINAIKSVNQEYEKLIQNFNEAESKQKVIEGFTDLFDELGLSIQDFAEIGFNKEGTVGYLEQIGSQGGGAFRKEFEKAASPLRTEMDIDIQKVALDEFNKAADELFNIYELTKEMKDQGVDTDILGAFGVTPLGSADDLRKSVTNLANNYRYKEKLGTDFEKAVVKLEEQITKKEVAEQKKRVQNYAKFLATTYSERAKLYIDTYADISQAMTDFDKSIDDINEKLKDQDITPGQREALVKQVQDLTDLRAKYIEKSQKDLQDRLTEMDVKDFIQSDIFVEMFQDLSRISTKVLDKIEAKMKEIMESGKLTFSQMKQMSQQLEKVQTAKIQNAGTMTSIRVLSKAKNLRKQGVTREGVQSELFVNSTELQTLKKLKDEYSVILDLKNKGYNGDEKELNLTKEQKNLLQTSPEFIRQQTTETNTTIDSLQKKQVVLEEQNTTFKDAETAAKKLETDMQLYGQIGAESVGMIKEGIIAMGGKVDDVSEIWMDFGANALQAMLQLAAQMIILNTIVNATAGILGLIATAITLITSAFTAFTKAHDTKITNKISKIQKAIEKLSDAYDDLKEHMENAFTMTSLVDNSEKAEENIQKQIDSYQEMIKLEEDKKKTDQDTIDSYKDSIADLKEELEELHAAKIQALGGFGDESSIQDMASSFAEAWLDAYKETGDGLDALQDQWDEYIDNLMLKQMTLRVVGKKMSKLSDMIDSALGADSAGGENLTTEELAEINAMREKLTSELNDELKEWVQLLGYNSSSGELSDLQKGIQNITESQAAALESYVNSIRFYVVSNNQVLTNILNEIRAQYGTNDSPLLSVTKEIRDTLNNFYKTFKSVTETQTGRGTVLKVN